MAGVAEGISKMKVVVRPELERVYEVLASVHLPFAVCVELESMCAELVDSAFEMVENEWEDTKSELGALLVKVTAFEDEVGLAREEEAHMRMWVERFQEGRRVVDKEIKGQLEEGFDLRREIERLRVGKVRNGREKGMRMLVLPPPPLCIGMKVQSEAPVVSTVSIQTDVARVHVVRKTTYASVASQACPGGVPVVEVADVVMAGTGGVPVPPLVGPVAVRAQLLLIHGVEC